MEMSHQIQELQLIPTEILNIVPLFNGDKRHLNLFIRKCEYVINKFKGSPVQNLYVFHSLTSRVTDSAAALLSERGDVCTWEDLKELLLQHFGDSRSEETIAFELDCLRKGHHESYQEFCNRIVCVRSLLISKAKQLEDPTLRDYIIDNYMKNSLNVFLFNLPENMVMIVRLKQPKNLEDALKIVLEEVSFYEQYSLHNKQHHGYEPWPYTSFNKRNIPFSSGVAFGATQPSSGYKPPQPVTLQALPASNSSQPSQLFGGASTVFGSSSSKPHFGSSQSTGLLGASSHKFGSTSPQPLGYKPELQTISK